MGESLMDDEESRGSSYDNRPANIHVFAASSTLHGFSHVFARHHSSLRRFAWAMAFLTSFTLLIFQSTNRAVYYLQFPHVTRLDEVAAGNLTFPAITICNVNEFRLNEVTKNDMYFAGQLLGFLNKDDEMLEPPFLRSLAEGNITDFSAHQELERQKKWIEKLTNFRTDFT